MGKRDVTRYHDGHYKRSNTPAEIQISFALQDQRMGNSLKYLRNCPPSLLDPREIEALAELESENRRG